MPLTQVSSRLIEDTLRYVLGASGTDHYTFTGKGLNGAVNDPTLTLSRGHTYIFENRNSNGAHPFYIKTSLAGGGTNNAYNTGVTNNGGAGGTEIIFTVPHDAPNLLYYQCSSHSNMNGQLKIADALVAGTLPTGVQVLTTNISSGQLVTGHIAAGTGFQVDTNNIVDDAVTEDKLANSINSAIAANTAKDLTALSASNLTSGTIPDARFPATLPAVSAANLTSIPSANLTGALPAISGANLTGIGGGITVAQTFRRTSNTATNDSTTYFADSNWEKSDGTLQGGFGSFADPTNGIFTFPTTGFYLVAFQGYIEDSGYSRNNDIQILATSDNNSYSVISQVNFGIEYDVGSYAYASGYINAIIDVTDLTNHKVKFGASSISSVTWDSSNTADRTAATFIRLGDT